MKTIDFSPPDISEQEISEVMAVLRSGWITTGLKTKQFENDIAEFTGARMAACVSSGTAAMELTLRLFGIGPGDEVITTAYTYTATASVILHVGARPVLVDTAPDSFEINYKVLEKAITPRTKAIIPVDVGGVIADYRLIRSIAEKKSDLFQPCNELQENLGRILILGDAAHSIGAVRDGVSSGLHADFTAFSTHAVKNVTTAEGGAITWRSGISGKNDDEIYQQYRLMSLHGQTKDALQKNGAGGWEYDIIAPYYKCNMTDIHAALGVAQLHRYPELLARRKEICRMYDRILNTENVRTLKHFSKQFESSRHLYLARVQGIDSQQRDTLIEKLREKGVPANVHYKPLPMLSAYKNLGLNIVDFPNAYHQYENCISLPLHTMLSDDDVVYVANTFINLIEGL